MTADGGWLELMADVNSDSCYNAQNLMRMRVTGNIDATERLEKEHTVLFFFCVHLLSEYVVRFYPIMEGLPGSATRLLATDQDQVLTLGF